MIQVGGIDATRIDLELPARRGLLQTIGDTTGVGGVFRALRTFPVLSGIAARHARAVPRRLVPQLHEPDGDERLVDVGGRPRHQDRRPLPQRVLDRARPVRARSASRSRAPTTARPASTTRPGSSSGRRDGEDLYPRAARSASQPTPSSSAACASRSSAASATTRPRRASTRRSTCRWFLRSDEQIERFRLRAAASTSASPRRTWPSSSTRRTSLADRRRRCELEEGRRRRVRAAGHPLDPHRHRARDPRQRREPRPHRQPARGRGRRGARAPSTATGVAPASPSARCPPQGAALNRTYLSVAELTIEAARTGDPRAGRARPCSSTRTRARRSPRHRSGTLCDELTRGARATSCPTRSAARSSWRLP